jgi:hypothetical protein
MVHNRFVGHGHGQILVVRPQSVGQGDGFDLFSTPPDYMLIYALIGWFVCWLIGKAVGKLTSGEVSLPPLTADLIDKVSLLDRQFSDLHLLYTNACQRLWDVERDARVAKDYMVLLAQGKKDSGGMLNFIKERCKPFTVLLVDRLLKIPKEQWTLKASYGMSVDLPEFYCSIRMDEREIVPMMAELSFSIKKNGKPIISHMNFSPMERFFVFMSLSPIYYKVANRYQTDPAAEFYDALKTEPVEVVPIVDRPLIRRVESALDNFAAKRLIHTDWSHTTFIALLKEAIAEKGYITRKQLTESPFTTLHPMGINGVFLSSTVGELVELLGKLGVCKEYNF